jgi:uncharacterized protein YecT (DUF1311 family)
MFILALLAATNGFMPQSAANPSQVVAMQREKEEAYFARRVELREKAKTVLAREMAREKNGDCLEVVSTADTNICLTKEIETTTANYKEYIADLHALFGLEGRWKETDSRAQTSEEAALQFDEVEKAWQAYQTARCSAVHDNFRPGTIAPQMAADCRQRLTRNHMRELDEIYDPILWH